ncbi:XTP/dITP diphosphatase [Methanoplanus sp. FWC-SCC4]|uniref:XTP/dITP diphosphatase n=2 Tax=Methanochimaera problematica TaxID=2609417 RepID=A0AA97FH65_9EURY|nr:XTP/dITP diphosphatase [Methanoplanus sp. FWC-SCC4]WOF17361.1 XTP/dITP diphosphatase [Methanoplanus sp. FWC-SCC4]
MNLKVVTGNPDKAKEVEEFFNGKVRVGHVKLDLPEIKDNDVGNIARVKAKAAYDAVKEPLIVDDTGFYISSLNGFPGAYAAFVLDTIGMEGILRLMENQENRCAYFETAIAYADEDGVLIFRGRVEGSITTGPRGSEGFGYDPIFEVSGKTFAEIPLKDKSAVSHRGRALEAFGEWYLKKQ